ncbi:hypothetical protein Tco_1073324 [Tanacetum coccineum]
MSGRRNIRSTNTSTNNEDQPNDLEGMVQTRGREAALRLTSEEFNKLLLKEYYPKSEVQKLESEFWNHTMRISVSIALERHLEEIHVTWDQFRKRNRTRWQMGMKTELKNEDQRVETSSGFIVTPSKALSDAVWIYCDAVWISRQI